MSEALTATEPVNRPALRQHAAFCRAVAGGLVNLTQAYRKYIAAPGTEQTTVYANASDLARRYSAWITQLRERLMAQADKSFILSKAEALQFASRVVRTPLAGLEDDSDLIQEKTVTDTEHGQQVKIKTPGKLEALAFISKVSGWDAPTQVNHTHVLIESPALAMLDTSAKTENPRIIEAEIVPDSGKAPAKELRTETPSDASEGIPAPEAAPDPIQDEQEPATRKEPAKETTETGSIQESDQQTGKPDKEITIVYRDSRESIKSPKDSPSWLDPDALPTE